jgi:hypothetical protein
VRVNILKRERDFSPPPELELMPVASAERILRGKQARDARKILSEPASNGGN